jgi:hypothetical protein
MCTVTVEECSKTASQNHSSGKQEKYKRGSTQSKCKSSEQNEVQIVYFFANVPKGAIVLYLVQHNPRCEAI